MTEQTNAGDGNNNNQNNNQNNNGGSDAGANQQVNGQQATTQQNQNNQQSSTFDPSKISDEEFGKVFEDPRTFNHSRFKELTAKAKKAEEYEAAEKQRKDKELASQGKFEELAKQKEAEAQALKDEIKTSKVNNALLIAAQKLNAVDLDAVIKLVDRSKIAVNDDGTITGIDEAVQDLQKGKAFLFGAKGNVTVGNGTNPGGDGQNNNQNLRRFKHSEILDPVFYQKNEKDILASQRAGLIEDDMNPGA